VEVGTSVSPCRERHEERDDERGHGRQHLVVGHQDVAAHVEIESKIGAISKAVYHIALSDAYLLARSTWIS
jgi:hypothetical protein